MREIHLKPVSVVAWRRPWLRAIDDRSRDDTTELARTPARSVEARVAVS